MKAIQTARTIVKRNANNQTRKAEFEIGSKALINNVQQLMFRFLPKLCVELGFKTRTTTAYHPQVCIQVKHIHTAVFKTRLHNFAEHQKNWDTLASLLT